MTTGKQAKTPMFSVISHQPWTPLPGVRHPAAPGRKASGWRAEEYLTQSPPSPPREHEESGRKELTRRRGDAERLEDAFAQKDKKETKGRLECGRKANIENHENRSADMERGREADEQPGGARPVREVPGKRKPAKRPMFSVISHPATRLEAALSRSPAMLLQKLPRHFRRCGILPRHGGWSAEGIREGGNPQESLECRLRGRERLGHTSRGLPIDGAGWEC